MKMIKNFGLIALIFLILISLVLIVYPEITTPTGVIITSVDADSSCKDIMTIGSTIGAIGNKIVKNSNEFTELTRNLEGVVTFMINNNPRSCNIPEGSRLNITVTDVKKGGIKLGIDLWGGVYYLFEPKEMSQDLINNIKQRSVKYGLSNTKIELYNDSFVKIITGPDEESYVNLLVEQGKLEGVVVETIDFTKKTVEFMFNDKPYEISLKDKKSVRINESEYGAGNHFKLDGVDVVIKNISENTTTLSIKIFDNEDLTLIQSSRLGYSRIAKQGSGYVFAVPVELSEKASEDFKKVTKNLEVLVNPTTGESYSKYPISILIDEKEFISIPILSEEMGEKRENLILWSYLSNIEEATKDMVRLKTIIETKSLPQQLTLVKRESFKSTHGESLTILLLFVALIASTITAVLFFIKFKKNGVASLPLIIMVLSELVLVFGVLSSNYFALLIFCVGIVVIVLGGKFYDWKGWMGVFLFFILIIGMVVSKWDGYWALDASFVKGLMMVILIGFGQNVFIGMKVLTKRESYTPSDYKNASTKLWLFSTIFAFILIILYFIFNSIDFMSTSFIMVVSMGLWINLSLVLPVYSNIVKKFIK